MFKYSFCEYCIKRCILVVWLVFLFKVIYLDKKLVIIEKKLKIYKYEIF